MSSIAVKDVEVTNSLIWFRNDLRINDHPGINSALSISGKVIGFYCFNSSMFKITNLQCVYESNLCTCKSFET